MANVRYPGTAGTTPGTITAADVTYDNTTSGLTADDVQEAIDEIEGQIGSLSYDASDISYDNTTSGLTADDVQEAIDEVDSNVDTLSSTVTTLSGKVYKTDDSTETTIASDDLLPIYDTSATASKKITVANVVKATVSNPNLLDNPWFTVNQRGQNSYTSVTSSLVYNFDRWATWAGATGSITVASASQGVDVTVTSDAEDNQLTQRMDIDLTGKIITLSLDVNGIIYTATGEVPARTSSWQSITIDTGTGVRCNFNVAPIGESISCATTIRCGKNNTTYNIRAIKLEIGSVSTLAMDTAPNYATELLKCQRYFRRIINAYQNAPIATLQANSNQSSTARGMLPFSMRTTPTVTAVNPKLRADGVSESNAITATLSAVGNGNVILVATATNLLNADKVYQLITQRGGYIDLSADL